MPPNARHSLQPLTIYPHLHRDSQCYSCSTVMPGDICFNCGRLSTLLVTPRPPWKLVGRCASAPEGPASTKTKPVLQNKPFESQDLTITKERPAQPFPNQRPFDSQLMEVEDLLDARKKMARIHTLAANKLAQLKDKIMDSSYERFTSSSRPSSVSSTAHSAYSLDSFSKTLRSGSIAGSDILSENGRPHAQVVARWLEARKPSGRSDAKSTARGVDCRLNMQGRVCEWVIFL